MAITTPIQAPVTKTAAFNGAGLDISAMTKPVTGHARVTALGAGQVAILALQDSADNFVADIVTLKTWEIKGLVDRNSDVALPPVHDYEMPAARIGIASAKIRLALTFLSAGGSVTYDGWLDVN